MKLKDTWQENMNWVIWIIFPKKIGQLLSIFLTNTSMVKKKKNYFLILFFIFFIFYFFYFLLFLFFILGDFWTYGTFVQNITGLNDYFNILSPKYPPNPFQQYLNRNDVRNATHGKNLFFILLFYFIFLNNIFIF